MKNSLKFLALAAIGVLAAASCQKNELRDNNSEDLFFSLRTSDTKTYMVSNPDGSFSPNWNNGDEIGVFFENFASDKETPAGKLSNTNDSGATAKFEGTISSAGESGTIYAFYPASALGKTYAKQSVGFDMPSIQHPTATSFDPAADILVAKPVGYSATEGNVVVENMQFARVLAILKVNLNSDFADVKNQKVIKFSIKSETAVLSGRPAVTLTASDGKITVWNVKNKEVTAAYDETSTVAVAGTDNKVFLTINPKTIPCGEKLTFNIETEKYIITKEVTLPGDIVFTPGNLTEINLSIGEANCKEKVDTDYSGDYLIVSGDYLMTDNAGDYFNLIKADGSTLQDFWKVDGIGNYVWTVAKTPAGNYTFYNDASGKYMALTTSGNKAYVVDTADEDDAKFTIKEEDSVLNIYNVKYADRKLRCNSGSSRFAFYTTDTGTAATILTYTPDSRPTFDPVSGLSWDASGKTLSWTAAEGATNGYEYTKDNGETVTASESNSIDCSSWTNGDYSVKVRVVATDAKKTSEWSEACEFTISGGVAAQEFKLFTSDIEEGDYVIYYGGKAMKASITSSRLDCSEITPSNNVISNPDASIVWHIASSGDYWTIYNEDAKKFAASTGTKNQAALIASGDDDKSLWSVSNTSGKYEFVNKLNSSKGINANLRNNGTYGFACYGTSTGGALSLFKLDEVAVTSITVSGTPTKTSYKAGESFDTDGLAVKATYEDSSEKDVTSSVAWTISPDPLTVGTTSVSVVAKYRGVSSSPIVVNGLTVTEPEVPALSTMDAIFAAATAAGSSAKDAKVKFDSWVVSGVKNNNAYLTDNNGKGLIIYTSGHGFAVGDILNGTVNCKVQLYKGAAELTSLTSTTEGLTVTKGGTTTPATIAIANLSGVNTGAVITFESLQYNGTDFTDGANTIKPYYTFISLPTLINGRSYSVTGVYIQYDSTKEIAPRTDNDIVEKDAPKYAVNVGEGITNGTVTVDCSEATEGQTVTITATPSSGYKVKSVTAKKTASGDAITVTNNKFTMPAEAVTVSAEFEETGSDEPVVLTFDLSKNPGSWPTANSTTLTNYTYSLGDTSYSFGLKNVKCNSGYLMLTSTAVLGLPAIDGKKLTKVVAKNSGGCSTTTKVGISSSSSSASYISGGAIQTWSTTSSSYTYTLSGTSNNTVYYLYVTNKNAQITELTLTYE